MANNLAENAKTSFIDVLTKERLEVELEYNGKPCPLNVLADSLVDYLEESSDAENGVAKIRNEQQPLAAALLVPLLSAFIRHNILDEFSADTLLASVGARHTLMWSVMIGFLICDLVRKKELQIQTKITQLTDEEIKAIFSADEATRLALAAEQDGVDLEEIFRQIEEAGRKVEKK
jgi:hypothetical protein